MPAGKYLRKVSIYLPRLVNEIGHQWRKHLDGAGEFTKARLGSLHTKGKYYLCTLDEPKPWKLKTKGIVGEKVKNIYLLNSGAELSFQKSWWGNNEQGNLFITVCSSPQKPVEFENR